MLYQHNGLKLDRYSLIEQSAHKIDCSGLNDLIYTLTENSEYIVVHKIESNRPIYSRIVNTLIEHSNNKILHQCCSYWSIIQA